MARILIVDDEPLIAMMLEAWVADLGHEPVGPAHSVAEATALLDGKVDAGVVDLALGAESGLPVVEALAARGAPFVYATGQDETQLDGLPPAGAVLLKPYSFGAFEAALKAILPDA